MEPEKMLEDLKKSLVPEIVADGAFMEALAKSMTKPLTEIMAHQKKAVDVASGKFDTQYKKDFVGLIQAVAKNNQSQYDMYAKALNTGTNNQGGYLIPTEFMGEASRLSGSFGVFRRNTVAIPFSGSKATFGTIGSVTISEQANELDAKTDSTPTIGNISITMKTLYALVIWSNQFADMSPVAIFDVLLQRTAEAMAYAEDVRGIVGSATFTGGILQNSAAFGAVTATGHTTGATIDTTDCISALTTINPAALAGAKWYMSTPQFINIVTKKASSGDGHFIIDPVTAITTRTLLGFPVELTETMYSNASTGQKAIIFGNLKQSTYLFEDQTPARVAVATEATIGSVNLFAMNASAMRAEKYMDVASFSNIGTNGSSGKSIVIISTA